MSLIRPIEHQSIRTVAELLSETRLSIPEYQRPYKWTTANVASLFEDLMIQSDKPAYRLGSIVLHQPKDKDHQLNIVDGQQRTLTLMLTVLALYNHYRALNETEEVKQVLKVLGELPKTIDQFCTSQKFSNHYSQFNLRNNYQEIVRIIKRGNFTFKHVDFLLNHCEVVIFILDEIQEAFQFFDSQNSRGKDLYPHDLLKAFHLREFDTHDEDVKAYTVAHWESLDDNDLAKLLSMHLYRIRCWSRGKPAQNFTKNDVDEFKGITISDEIIPPYAKSMMITHHYVDGYNASLHRKIKGESLQYPFRIDQTIINGKRFFEMVSHYDMLIKDYKSSIKQKTNNGTARLFNSPLNERSAHIITTLNSYKNRTRDGDEYTRNLFDNTVIYYIDKFGTKDLPQAIERIFVWVYRARLINYAVKLATIDNHAKDKGLLLRIRDAITTKDLHTFAPYTVSMSEIKDYSRYSETPKSELIEANPLFATFKWLSYVD